MTCNGLWLVFLRGCPAVASILYRGFCLSRVSIWDIQNRMQELTGGFQTEFEDLWAHSITWKADFLYNLEWTHEVEKSKNL